MDEKQLNDLWEHRKETLPSSYTMEELEGSVKEYAEKTEETSGKFMLVHTEHGGKIILRHEMVSEVPVELSLKFRDWEFVGSHHEFDGVQVWKYTLVCSCGERYEVVGEDTPDELKAI